MIVGLCMVVIVLAFLILALIIGVLLFSLVSLCGAVTVVRLATTVHVMALARGSRGQSTSTLAFI